MKKSVVVLLAALVLASSASALDIGIGYIRSGSLHGPAFIITPVPMFTIEAGVNVSHVGMSAPSFTSKYKEWESPDTEPEWTSETETLDGLKASAMEGTFGLRVMGNLQRPNALSKFYAGLGVNATQMLLKVTYNHTYENLDASVLAARAADTQTISLIGEVNVMALQCVAFAGAEIGLKDIPNFKIRAEMGYGLTLLGKIYASLSSSLTEGGDSSNYKRMLELTPNANWGETYASVGAAWYF